MEPVGLAMGTALIALALAALLNANGMHRNASIQPDSPARDVAMAVTGAVADLSGNLGLTEPRHLIASAVGNETKDDIVTSIGTAPARKAPPPTPLKRTFTRSRPMKLYAGGDSLSLETADALSAAAPKTGVIDMAEPDGHLSTGLIRPDTFNWFERAKEVEATIKPDVSVLIFGGNDNDSYMTGGPDGGFAADFGSPKWRREYGRRVGLVMDTLTQRSGQTLVWVGAPVAQDAQLDSQMKVLSSVYRAEATKRKGSVVYFDPDPLFAPNGQYQTSIVHKGSQVVVREPDGQHLNTEGGVVLADEILSLLGRRFNLAGAKPDGGTQSG
ncbi:MAG: hypothetical protein WCO96_00045 [Actinomycetes bacterium]